MTVLVLSVLISLGLIFLWRFSSGLRELRKISGTWMSGKMKDVFRVKWFLTVISLSVVVISLAFALFDVFPQTSFEPDETVGTEIVFLLDISRSMNASDITPSRLEKAADVIRSITERSRGISKALVVFKGTGLTVIPVTEDDEAIYSYLNNISSDFLSSPGTNIEEGLKTALGAFSISKSKNKYLFIFTDGEALGGNESRVASAVEKLGVEVAVIGVGTEKGSNIETANGFVTSETGEKVVTRLDETRLKQLTQNVKGSYIHIQSSTALSELSREVSGESESFREVTVSRYRIYLVIALFGLFVYFATRVIRWKDCF